jgi:hypothetical protein
MQFIKRPRTELDETDEQKPCIKSKTVRACDSNIGHYPHFTDERCASAVEANWRGLKSAICVLCAFIQEDDDQKPAAVVQVRQTLPTT